MGCSMGPQIYITTVTSNLDVRTDHEAPFSGGLFNPVTPLLPLSQFDRIRVIAEVLSGTPHVQMCAAFQMCRDGVDLLEIGSTLEENPSADVAGATEWIRTPWIPATSGGGNCDYLRVGVKVFTSATSPTVREMGVVRMRVEFKMGT